PVVSLALSPDGKKAVTGCLGKALLWEVATGRLLATLDHQSHVYAVAFSPDGTHIVTGSHDGAVKFWKTESGQEDGRLPKLPAPVWRVHISRSGGRVLTISDQSAAHVWDLRTHALIGSPFAHEKQIGS